MKRHSNKNKWKRFFSRPITWLIVVLPILTAVALFLWGRQPVYGILHLPDQTSLSRSDRLKDVLYEGKTFSLTYPDSFRQLSELPSHHIESAAFVGKAGSNKRLAVMVRKATLDEEASVQLRRLHRSTYTEELIQLGDYTAVIFTNVQVGWEKSAFFAQEGMVAAITLTDPGGDDLTTEFMSMIQSFRWN